MNAVVTRNRELISRSGSHVRAADGVARGGDPPRHSVFFFAKSVTFRGVFLIDVIYFTKWAVYHPLIQIRGKGISFLSLKLATIQSTSQLMDCVEARVSRTPELLRPPMPKALAELRLKLGVGVVPKAPPSPAEAATLGNESETEFSAVTKAKVRMAIARAQKEDNKQPEDMERLLIANNRAIAANFQPPPPGKKNGGKVSNTHALAL